MRITHDAGKSKKTVQKKSTRKAKKGLMSSMIVEMKDAPHDHDHHPVHCPTCHRRRIARKHEHRLVGSRRTGRPGPEC